MKFRCPYCKHIFGPDPKPVCPGCGKNIMIPDRLLKRPYRERKKIKERIAREADKERSASFAPDIGFGRQPATVFILLVLMLVTGAALLSRILPARKPAPSQSREMVAEQDLYTLRIAIERFRIDCYRYPSADEGLKALVLDPGAQGWNGPYVNIVKPDPWHTPYNYRVSGNSILLTSHGPDTKPNTADDIQAAPPAPEHVAR